MHLFFQFCLVFSKYYFVMMSINSNTHSICNLVWSISGFILVICCDILFLLSQSIYNDDWSTVEVLYVMTKLIRIRLNRYSRKSQWTHSLKKINFPLSISIDIIPINHEQGKITMNVRIVRAKISIDKNSSRYKINIRDDFFHLGLLKALSCFLFPYHWTAATTSSFLKYTYLF